MYGTLNAKHIGLIFKEKAVSQFNVYNPNSTNNFHTAIPNVIDEIEVR